MNYFHSLMRSDALHTFRNITSSNRENSGEILTVFRRKNVKPQSMATGKHILQRLVFIPTNQKLIDFIRELQKLAKMHSELLLKRILSNSCMPKCLSTCKSINQAHLQNGRHEQTVSHPERELEMNGSEAPDELQMNTVTQQASQQNPENPNQLVNTGKSQVTIETSAVNSNPKKT